MTKKMGNVNKRTIWTWIKEHNDREFIDSAEGIADGKLVNITLLRVNEIYRIYLHIKYFSFEDAKYNLVAYDKYSNREKAEHKFNEIVDEFNLVKYTDKMRR